MAARLFLRLSFAKLQNTNDVGYHYGVDHCYYDNVAITVKVLKHVSYFKYPGSRLTSTVKDTHVRKVLDRQVTNRLNHIWKSPQRIKINIFLAIVKQSSCIVFESWTQMNQHDCQNSSEYKLIGRPNRTRAPGHYHRHREEFVEQVLFWEPKHRMSGSRNKAFAQVLEDDPGPDRVTEIFFHKCTGARPMLTC